MLLAIHDVSFPSDADEDIGRGSPSTRAADRLFAFARSLGFTGIQLGPQGQTARSNPSPYDGTIFSRHVGNIALRSLRAGGAFAGLIDDRVIDAAVITGGGSARYLHAHDAMHALLDDAYCALERGARPDLRERLTAFRREHAAWLESDALHTAYCESHGGAGFRDWPARDRDLWITRDDARYAELRSLHARAIDRYAFAQLLVHDEHAHLRARIALALYGDLQVGYSDADAWVHAGAFLDGYSMGAPPSRTNPDGQPWGYPVLDPAQADRALALVIARANKAFAEYDSLRIDHPHGLVCPWVYRDDVRRGARLFESPDIADLAPFAIARLDQLNATRPRYADDWVHDLDAAQVDRYARFIDAILNASEHNGRSRADLSCEVLSTMPYQLGRVLARHGLGRWRVTQKANLDDPHDVYRTETVAREDWLMLGNHDTPPIFAVIRAWSPAEREKWARHLAARLRLLHPQRLVSDRYLASAMLAELFVSAAENVSIFFADLFGVTERFNVPGVIDDANWTLRLPPDFEALHASQLAHECALDVPLAVDIAVASQS